MKELIWAAFFFSYFWPVVFKNVHEGYSFFPLLNYDVS